MNRKRAKWVTAATIAAGILFGILSSYVLTLKRYEIHTSKIDASVRLLLISDLHSCYYGENQIELVSAIEACSPDVLMFCGDIADDKMPIDNVQALLDAVANKYPCFYVTGNHEFWSGKVDDIKYLFQSHGVTVLERGYAPLSIRREKFAVCGLDDPVGGHFDSGLIAAAEGVKTGFFSVLLSHRPERFPQYIPYGFDLVLAGHAHGGLWRIPGILNGLIAPDQGFFPKYAGGEYQEGQTTMIVSRGLARESTRLPRFFNPVELVVIDLLPLARMQN
ncbi:MAG: metallophosphoesterase [Synergistaceae bacterium]|jgi:predicted MPP superfamily phosphohydrolase|nr:metallophosphoesterase [Synergistaceae bacterium]